MHHITQHARSHLAGHTFLGHARPRKINASQPHLSTTEQSARRSNPKRAGVWAHRPMHTCTLRTRPRADLATHTITAVTSKRSNTARATQSLTSRRLRLIPRRRDTHNYSRVDQMARLRSNTKISLSVLSNREHRPGPGPPLTWVVSTCPVAPPQRSTCGYSYEPTRLQSSHESCIKYISIYP